MPAPVVCGKTFTRTDAAAAADQVTAFNVKFGAASGVYDQVCQLDAADVAAMLSAGTVSDDIAALIPAGQLTPGNTYFAVATAVNATGESGPSPEFKFTVAVPLPLPQAPSSFIVA